MEVPGVVDEDVDPAVKVLGHLLGRGVDAFGACDVEVQCCDAWWGGGWLLLRLR